MAFFLIVPSIMVISMVLVHGAASSVGLKIKYIPLAMCGVLSFSALFGAMNFSPNPDRFFFIYLHLLGRNDFGGGGNSHGD